jgi:hypothetical protein
MEHVRASVVAHRSRPADSINLGVERLPHRYAAMKPAAMDDQSGRRALSVCNCEDDVARRGLKDALVTDLAPTFGVEGRLVEHDLSLGIRR